MTSTERYRNDPAYRDRCLARVKARHLANAQSATYRKLVATRKTIWQLRESVSRYRLKIDAARIRLWRLERRKETLELAFGQERAARKRKAAA